MDRWDDYLDKLLGPYNPNGLPFLFLVSYVNKFFGEEHVLKDVSIFLKKGRSMELSETMVLAKLFV